MGRQYAGPFERRWAMTAAMAAWQVAVECEASRDQRLNPADALRAPHESSIVQQPFMYGGAL